VQVQHVGHELVEVQVAKELVVPLQCRLKDVFKELAGQRKLLVMRRDGEAALDRLQRQQHRLAPVRRFEQVARLQLAGLDAAIAHELRYNRYRLRRLHRDSGVSEIRLIVVEQIVAGETRLIEVNS
jgi:hypothetical protein